jgi:peptidyl-tRNA hydrolase, PTH1 family
MILIVGLGNHGKEYARNRHNVGFFCITYLAKQHSTGFKLKQCRSETGTGEIAGARVLMAKPHTYVNSSGEAVQGLMHKYKIGVDDLIVICDDLDLPLGKIRIRKDGGAGGHNGLKSIIACIGSREFKRVRIGIGRPDEGRDRRASEDEIVDYVLSNFTSDEEKIIKQAIPKTAEAVEEIISNGIDSAMNKFN